MITIKRRLLFPLLEKFLIRLGIVAETTSLSKDALRVLIRASFGLVLLVHVLAVTTPRFAGRLADGWHGRPRLLRSVPA